MTPNEEYKKVFETDISALYDEYKKVFEAANQEAIERIGAEQKRRQPRKRKHFDPLPDGVIDEIREELLAKYPIEEMQKEYKEKKEHRKSRLWELAHAVEIQPVSDCWEVVSTSSKGAYSSQGYGAKAYAEGSLYALRDKLKRAGIKTDIVWDESVVRLFAACPKWMADAAEKSITTQEWLDSCGIRLNPKVYNPFMSSEDLMAHYDRQRERQMGQAKRQEKV